MVPTHSCWYVQISINKQKLQGGPGHICPFFPYTLTSHTLFWFTVSSNFYYITVMIDSVTPVMTVLLGTEGSFYIYSPPVSSQRHSLLSLSWQLVPPSFSPSTFNHPILLRTPLVPLPLAMSAQHHFLLEPHSRVEEQDLYGMYLSLSLATFWQVLSCSCAAPWKSYYCPYLYEGVWVINYMEMNLTRAEEVLNYLYHNARTRLLLRRVSEVVLSTGWDTTSIVHPLMHPTIRLESYHSDTEFVELIYRRSKVEIKVTANHHWSNHPPLPKHGLMDDAYISQMKLPSATPVPCIEVAQQQSGPTDQLNSVTTALTWILVPNNQQLVCPSQSTKPRICQTFSEDLIQLQSQ